MPRFAPAQPDLFRAVAPAVDEARPSDPIAELTALLTWLRAAETPPWPNLSAAMADEYRALHLAREAGQEGAALAAAVMEQTERLLSQTD